MCAEGIRDLGGTIAPIALIEVETDWGLRLCHVIQYDPDLEQLINSGELLPAGVRECEVRAGAVVACEKIIAESDGRVNASDLDSYLWRVGECVCVFPVWVGMW